jgi:hypothetical protein
VSLAEMLQAVARELDAEEGSGGDGSLTWSRAGRPFAAISGARDAAEFALDPAVASAAMRTPDVGPSERGVGWVVFRPRVLDDHARDRATAWFESAHRRLGR